MSLATQIIDQQVSGIVEAHAEILSEELGAGDHESKKRSMAFLFLAAKTALGLNDEEAFDGIVDGGNDFGIDALYFTQSEGGELSITLMQGKYKTDLNNNAEFSENAITNMIAAIDTIFDPDKPVEVNRRLEQRIEEIRSFVREGVIPRIDAVAVSNGQIWPKRAQQRIDNAAERYGDQVHWEHIGADDLLALLQARKSINDNITLVGTAVVEEFNFRRVLVGRMPVAELARLTDQYGDQVFERNIRRYLGLSGNRVNEAMAKTLSDSEERANFYFYNNGITIICSQFRHNALQQQSWTVQVDDLQIVNGGQTSRTVQQVREKGNDLDRAEVLVRIYELNEDDKDIVDAITFATNSQNPVDLRDLKANHSLQKALMASIKGLGYTYRTKREKRPVSPSEFTSAVVAEAVLAIWRKWPKQARFRRRKHFGALYDRIFTRDLNGAQAVIAALLLRHAENRRKRPPPDAPDFLPYGSRFVAMLMGCYLLKDLGIELDQLDHRNFNEARMAVEKNAVKYMENAEQRIEKELNKVLYRQDRTLQRLSATFRRADLVEMLWFKNDDQPG